MAAINAIDITSLLFQEGSAPSTPASTKWRVYFKTDGLYIIDDAGTETGPLGTGGAASATYIGAKVSNSGATALTASTMTVLSWDTETFDSDGFHEGVTNPSRLTIPTGKDGKYLLHGSVGFGANAAADRIVRIRKNGSDATDLAYVRTPLAQSGSNPTRMQIQAVASLAATDYVELIVYTGATGTSTEATSFVTNFSISLLGT